MPVPTEKSTFLLAREAPHLCLGDVMERGIYYTPWQPQQSGVGRDWLGKELCHSLSWITSLISRICCFIPEKKPVEVGRWAGTQLAILLQAAAISRGLILTESQSACVIETSHFTFRISYPVRTEHLLLWPSKLSSSLCKNHLFLCL